MIKNISNEELKRLLEEAVTLGMGKGWMHNAGVSSRSCCPWKKVVLM